MNDLNAPKQTSWLSRRTKRLFFAFRLSIFWLLPLATAGAEFTVTNITQLDDAIRQARAGDAIIMANGVWDDADIQFTGAGGPESRILLRAEVPGKVFLTGSSRLALSGAYLVVEGLTFTNGYRTSGDVIAFRDSSSSVASNCQVSNCAVIGYNPPSPDNDTKWVSLYGFSNRVDHCYFKGKQNSGALLVVWLSSSDADKPNFHRIDHNYFGERPDLGQNGGEGMRVGDSATSFNVSHTIVEHNYFERCSGEIEIISNKSCENIYRYNTFVDCEGALTLRHGNRCAVEGNFFFGHGKTRTGGVRIIGEGHMVFNNYFQDLAGAEGRSALSIMQGLEDTPLNGYFQVKNAIVAFNTFVNCNNSLLIGLSDTLTGTDRETTLPPVDCKIANNIIRSTKNKLVDQRIIPGNMLWEGNFMFGTTLGISANTGITVTDPKLAQMADDIWRPITNSVALGNAQGDYSFITTDIDGQDRPLVKDAGCDQSSPVQFVRRLLTPADVGPEWMSPRLAIQSVTLDTQGFHLQWPGVAGASYQVQYSRNLLVWDDAGPVITNTSSLQTWIDDGSQIPNEPAPSSRFYRIKQLP
jgi:poly(beta-D-mannuronate) lyase